MRIEEVTDIFDRCNFCKPKYEGDTRIFTHDKLYSLQKDGGNSLLAIICNECLDELSEKTKDQT